MTVAIKPCTESRYWEMLEILPLAIMDGKGFLVGEPWIHRRCTATQREDQPAFAAFFKYGERFFEAEEPMTLAEYKAITPAAFHNLIASVSPVSNGPAP